MKTAVKTATRPTSGLFKAVDYGADGEGSSEYSLAVATADTGKYALIKGVAEHQAITLEKSGDVINGVAGGKTIFTVSIDASTGEVTLALTGEGSSEHPAASGNAATDNAAAHDNALSIAGVNVVLTATDRDGDTHSAPAAITLTIEDDGPKVEAAANATAVELKVDESYADGVAGPGLESTDGVSAKTATGFSPGFSVLR